MRRARTNSLGQNYEYIGRLFDKGLGRRIYKRDLEMSDADCNLDYLMNEQIIAGDVDEVLRRLLVLVEETGPFGTLVLMGYDWDDKASWMHSMRLFAEELMPALEQGGRRRASVRVLTSLVTELRSRRQAWQSRLRRRRIRIEARRARPGCLPPWTVGELPPAPPRGWRTWIKLIGPGVLLAGASIGSGEWLFGPAVSAQYGGTLLWLAGLSIGFQVFCNLEMMRYAVYSGESIIVGYLRTWPGPEVLDGVVRGARHCGHLAVQRLERRRAAGRRHAGTPAWTGLGVDRGHRRCPSGNWSKCWAT